MTPRKTRRDADSLISRNSASKKARMNEAKRRMYRRRRIAVCIALLLVLSLIVFCIISLIKGISAIGHSLSGNQVNIVRKAVPDPRPVGTTPRCNAKNMRLEISTNSQIVPMGGEVEITERFIYDGTSPCLIDASDINAVLTVSSTSDQNNQDDQNNQTNQANQTNQTNQTNDQTNDQNAVGTPVWNSSECAYKLNPLLMAKGDKYEKKLIWHTSNNIGANPNKNGGNNEAKPCPKDEDLPKVNRGTYILRLNHKTVPNLHSDPIVVTVK